MGDFDQDTRVAPLGEGRFRIELSRDWEIRGPNGGYIAAISLRAAGHEARLDRPACFSGHFLGVGDFSTTDIFVEPIEQGRLVLLIDTMGWIAASQPHPGPDFTAPNIDLTVGLHQIDPKSEWLLADHACEVATGGLMGATGRVWSENRRLLATGGAQLYCVPVPRPD